MALLDPSPDALRVLVALESCGSIGGAADELGISQQTASNRIAALERCYGEALVTRTAQGSTLTEIGTIVARHADDALRALDAARSDIDRHRGVRPDPITIAASLTIAEHLVPGWLLRVRGDGAPSPTLIAANSAAVVDLVRAGRADLGFVESTELPRDLRVTHLADDELVVVVAPDDAWARRDRPLEWEELAARAAVVREAGSGTRRSLDDLLRSRGIRAVEPTAVLATTAAVRTAIAAGLGPAVLSRLAVVDDVRLGRLVEVAVSPALIRPLSALTPAAGATPTATAFLRAIVDAD